MAKLFRVKGTLRYAVWASVKIDEQVEADDDAGAIDTVITEEYGHFDAADIDDEKLEVELLRDEDERNSMALNAPDVLHDMVTHGYDLRSFKGIKGVGFCNQQGSTRQTTSLVTSEILQALELAGYIEVKRESSTDIYYSITERGRKAASRTEVAA